MLAIVLIVLITLKFNFFPLFLNTENNGCEKKIIPFNTNEKKNVKSYLML